MRPRRHILLFTERVLEGGNLTFALDTRLRVDTTHVEGYEDFKAALSVPWDLIIIPHTFWMHTTTVRVALARAVGCPVLVTCWEKKSEPPSFTEADVMLPYGASNADLMERVRCLLVRRRGPKPARFAAAAVAS